MSGAQIEVVVDAEDLAKIQAVLSDSDAMKALFERLAQEFYAAEAEVFESQGGSIGATWDENSPRYAAVKAREFGKTVPMELTGAMRAGLTGGGGSGAVLDIGPDYMSIGTALPYADTHHRGSSETFSIGAPFNMTVNGVPARPLVAWTPRDEDRWTAAAEEWLRGLVDRMA